MFAANSHEMSDDYFAGVQIAVVGVKILKACVGAGTPNLGGQAVVGPKEIFVLAILGPRASRGAATS